MKKYIKFAFVMAFSLIVMTSCDDNKEEFLSDYNTILYFRNSGETPLTLYKTGENTDYTLVINKAGYKLNAVADVEVGVMDEASLEVYNAENGTSFKILPANCYSFTGNKLQFGEEDAYKNVPITFMTNAIDELSASNRWVLPLQLFNGSDSINAKKKVLLIEPEVIIPLIQFDVTGYQLNTLSDGGPTIAEMKIPLTLPIVNKWDFNCTVNLDQSLLDEYNKENEVDYALLPPAGYTMNNVVSFAPGSATQDMIVSIDRTKLTYGNYVLPLRLAKTNHPTFQINQEMNTCLVGVSYVPDESKLNRIALNPNMITYYPTTLNEGSVAAMFDNNAETYYHSQWSPVVALPHWIQVELPKTATAFKFEYSTRHNNANGVPFNVSLYGSEDGVTFGKIAVIKTGLPITTRATYTSAVYAAKPFKYFRFGIDKAGSTGSGSSFALAEFKLWTD
jgi:hypothetical protein